MLILVLPLLGKKLWEHYYNTLSKGIDVGFNPKLEMNDPELANSLKYDIAQFSAFKETSFRKQLEAALTANGKVALRVRKKRARNGPDSRARCHAAQAAISALVTLG